MTIAFKTALKAATSSPLGKLGVGIGAAALAKKILDGFSKWRAGGQLPGGATDCGWDRALDQKKPGEPTFTDCGWDRALDKK